MVHGFGLGVTNSCTEIYLIRAPLLTTLLRGLACNYYRPSRLSPHPANDDGHIVCSSRP